MQEKKPKSCHYCWEQLGAYAFTVPIVVNSTSHLIAPGAKMAMCGYPVDDQSLVKAAALIVGEIERRDRAERSHLANDQEQDPRSDD